jgi:hypothetical protein
MSFKIDLAGISSQVLNQVNAELPARAASASQSLRNASLEILRGQRGGRTYRKPGGGVYTASAPGEPPAVRSGRLRGSWRPVQFGASHQNPAIESNVPYTGYMENGTPGGMIAPRPFAEKIVEKARPEVEAIYSMPFNISP